VPESVWPTALLPPRVTSRFRHLPLVPSLASPTRWDRAALTSVVAVDLILDQPDGRKPPDPNCPELLVPSLGRSFPLGDAVGKKSRGCR